MEAGHDHTNCGGRLQSSRNSGGHQRISKDLIWQEKCCLRSGTSPAWTDYQAVGNGIDGLGMRNAKNRGDPVVPTRSNWERDQGIEQIGKNQICCSHVQLVH
jgi:hypothetical protein